MTDKQLNEKKLPEDQKKEKKKKKTKKAVEHNPSKKGCEYILTKEVDNVVYGRHCNDLCEYGELLCKNHIDKEDTKFDMMSDDLCKHIITQSSRNKDRKGMYCNKFNFGSPVEGYCPEHCKRHNDVNVLDPNESTETVLRSFKVKAHLNKQQIKKITNYYGCARFTYNKCVTEMFQGTVEEGRNKYVTESGNIYYVEDNPTIKLDYKKVIKSKKVKKTKKNLEVK